MEEIGTLRIKSTPTKFDSDGCQDLSLQVAAGGGEGNKPKQIFVVPKYMYSLYLIIRGLILSLGKGEGYRAHTLVVEILRKPQHKVFYDGTPNGLTIVGLNLKAFGLLVVSQILILLSFLRYNIAF
jgi:hypothetical protein